MKTFSSGVLCTLVVVAASAAAQDPVLVAERQARNPEELGACCVEGICIDDLPQLACLDVGGRWFEGESCLASPPFECPPPPVCPEGSLFSQNVSKPDEWLSAYASDSYLDQFMYENFAAVYGDISGVHWWGLELGYAGILPCEDPDVLFDVIFYPDVAGMPDTANPTCVYANIAPQRSATGEFYDGHELMAYSVNLSSVCPMVAGWISVQGVDGDSCVFMWMDSPIGDNHAFKDAGNGLIPVESDLNVCLTGEYMPTHAVCCHGYVCYDWNPDDEAGCLAEFGTFIPSVTCADDPCNCGGSDYRGDSNCDGLLNAYDVDHFIQAASHPADYVTQHVCDIYCANDANCDGEVNAYDIDGYIWCLHGLCDPCP